MNEAQRERIREYAQLGDRGTEPLFVGREDLFRTVAASAGACVAGQPQGQTVCLSGPSGIGKTAFLTELRRRGRRDWGGPPLAAASVPANMLHDPRVVLRSLVDALPDDWCGAGKGVILDRIGTILKRGASFSVFGMGAALGPAPPEPEGDILGDGLAEVLRGLPEGVAVCLFVDEAQQLDPTPGKNRNDLLANIHSGWHARHPLFVLLAGLAQTPDVIRSSISRLAGRRSLRMQALARSESKAYVNGILDYFGMEGPRRRLVDWIVCECCGFPHHLRSAMTALGEEVLHVGSANLKDLDLARVAKGIADLREDYYETRLSGLGPALPLARRLLDDWGPEGVSRERATTDARFLLTKQDESMREEVSAVGMGSGEKLFSAMIGSGLLAAGVDRPPRWRCLIPSLRQYVLTGTFRTRPPPDLKRGDPDR